MITRKKACFLSASHLKLPVRELGRAVRDRCERPPSSPAERGSRGQWGTVGVAGGGRDGRAPTLAQVRWGGVAGAARAAGEALISDLARTDRRFALVLVRASAHSQCTWGLSAELSVFASSKLKCQCTLCPALSVQNT